MGTWHPLRRRSDPSDAALGPDLTIVRTRWRAGGWLAALLGCTLVIGAAVLGIGAASDTFSRVTRDTAAGFVDAGATSAINEWREDGTPPGGLTGVVFGDSVFAPLTSDNRFVTALKSALPPAGLDVNLLDLTQAGYSAFQFYYLANRVLAMPPDFAVIEVNLRTFAPDWYGDPLQRFAPMAMSLTPQQVWRVHQALATQQVGFLTPLQWRVDEQLGGVLVLVDGVRVVGLGVLEALGTWANRVLGLSVRSNAALGRAAIGRHVTLTADHARLWYGHDFVTSPTAQVLRAFSEQMRAAGVMLLYVLGPVQRQTLEQLGISAKDLHARTEQLREMLQASPEQWVDATELYQTSDFLDGVHVQGPLIRRMTRPVVERLVPMMLARQRHRAVAATSTDAESLGASSAPLP